MTRNHLAAIALVGAVGLTDCFAGHRDDEPACHPLLMPSECRQMQDRLAKAGGDRERRHLRDAYVRLIAERERLCPYQDPRQAGAWRPAIYPSLPGTALF